MFYKIFTTISCLNSPSAYPESSQRGSPSQSTNNMGVEEIGEEHEKEVFISEAPVRIAVPDSLIGLEKTSFTECSEILYAVAKYNPYRNSHFEVVAAWTKVLNGLKGEGNWKERRVQWLRDRVTHLIEFHKEGGLRAIVESATNSSGVQGKRRRIVRKKFDLTEASVCSLSSISNAFLDLFYINSLIMQKKIWV